MVKPSDGGGGGGGMSVKIDQTALASAISKLSTLASSIESQRNSVTAGTPISLPSLSSGTIGQAAVWLKDQKPMLQGLHDIAVLLAEKGSTVASFYVSGTGTPDIKAMLGQTLAKQAGMGNPNFKDDQKKYLEIFAQWQYDPATMAAFQSTLGPEGTLRTLSMWAAAPADRATGDAPNEVQAALVKAMKQSLVTANQPGGFSAAESEAFAHGLVDAATVDGDSYYGRGPYNPSGALNYLLYDSTFNDTFIKTIGDDLDAYERVDHKGASGLWANRPEQGVQFGDYMSYGHYDPYAGNMDPMTGLMTAMSHNPRVALDWFNNDAGDPPRSEYYIKERNWGRDDYNGITQVLDAATTDPSILDGTKEEQNRAALLASKTVNYLSERNNADDLPEIMSRFPEDGASEDLAHILGTYMNGVVPGIDNKGADIGAYGNRPAFDSDSLKKVSLAAMATDQGLAELTNGMNSYRALHLGGLADTLAAHDTDDNRTLLRTGIQDDARLQGFFLNAQGDDKIHDAAERDARTRAMISHLTDVVDLVPIPGVSKLDGAAKDIANLTINTVKGSAYDSFADSVAHEESDSRSKFEDTATEANNREQLTMAQFLDDRGLSSHPDKLSALTRPNGHLLTYDEYSRLDTAAQDQVESELFGPNGVGGVYNRQDYSEAFKNEFDNYFD